MGLGVSLFCSNYRLYLSCFLREGGGALEPRI